jgi:amidase
LPVGFSFIGALEGDAAVLNAGYAYEQRARARVAPRHLLTVAAALGIEGQRR